MTDRLARIRARAQEQGADAVLLTSLPDVRWACGFTGSNGVLLVLPDGAHFVSDGRYLAQAHREVTGAQIHIPGYNLIEHVAEQRLIPEGARVLFQSDQVTVAAFESIRSKLPGVEWIPSASFLQALVAIKDADEIERMRGAQRITDQVFQELLGIIVLGMTEKELAAEIVYRQMLLGAEAMSFEPIVAAGPNGALPHATPSDRAFEPGDLVVLDFGCFRQGYASDMTRTVAVGEPGPEARKIYGIVLRALEAAEDAAHAGMTTRALDGVARDLITEAGFGLQFSHGLGHGLGLQIHEWPRVSYQTNDMLPAGVAVTIEPGIYLPEKLGVRIEDMVLLRSDGCTNLTASPRELIVL